MLQTMHTIDLTIPIASIPAINNWNGATAGCDGPGPGFKSSRRRRGGRGKCDVSESLTKSHKRLYRGRMAIQVPVAHSVRVVRSSQLWHERSKKIAFGCFVLSVCALVLRFGPSGDNLVLESAPPTPLSTHQSAVLEIVKNLTGTNASLVTDPALIGSEISPYTSAEWDAWEDNHFPKECSPTSSIEVAPDGRIVPTDFAADCSQMKEINNKQTILASVLLKAEKSPQVTTTTLRDLSAAITHLTAETEKESDVMKQVLHLSAMKMKKLQRLRIPGKQGPNQS